MTMPSPVLHAFIDRIPVVRARAMLDYAEVLSAVKAEGNAYLNWRQRLMRIAYPNVEIFPSPRETYERKKQERYGRS